MTAELVWEEPPVHVRGGRGLKHPRWDMLRARPGEWARIHVTSRKRWYSPQRYPGFEFTSQKQPDGSYVTWARYVGEDSP